MGLEYLIINDESVSSIEHQLNMRAAYGYKPILVSSNGVGERSTHYVVILERQDASADNNIRIIVEGIEAQLRDLHKRIDSIEASITGESHGEPEKR